MEAYEQGVAVEDIVPEPSFKALLPTISAAYLAEDEFTEDEDTLARKFRRRSSLGADSLLDNDPCDDGELCDEEDSSQPDSLFGFEYNEDIFQFFRRRERFDYPRRSIEKQPETTEHMRCILFNWLIKVNKQLGFSAETVFIGVGIADRIMECCPVAKDCLQLLAVCSLYIAAKLENARVPKMNLLVDLCGSTYQAYHFRAMEKTILKHIKFNLNFPTSWFFVNHLCYKMCHVGPMDRNLLSVARFMVERCLSSYKISQYFPSYQAAAAMVLSFFVTYDPAGDFNCSRRRSDREQWKISELNELSHRTAISLSWALGASYVTSEHAIIQECMLVMHTYIKPFLDSLLLTVHLGQPIKENIQLQTDRNIKLYESLPLRTIWSAQHKNRGESTAQESLWTKINHDPPGTNVAYTEQADICKSFEYSGG